MSRPLHWLLLATLAVGCADSAFLCESDASCGEAGAVCEAQGYCSFPDADCDSGRRFGELAGGGLAGMCVAPEQDGSSSSTTTSGSTTSTTLTTTSTSGTTEVASTGEPESPCGNGVLDDGELCDDGNGVDADGCNSDCVPSGTLRWSRVADEGTRDDKTYSVAEHPETGEVWAAGYSQNGDGDERWLVVRLAADGAPLSTELVDETFHGYSLGLIFDSQGVRYEAGEFSADGTVLTGIVRGFGAEPWTWQMPTDGGCEGRLDDIQVGEGGTLYVAGARSCATTSAPYLAAIEPGASAPTWEFEGDAIEGAFGQQLGVALTDAGTFVLGGLTRVGTSGDWDVAVYEVAAGGTETWRGVYAGAADLDDRVGPVAVLADGAYLAGGKHDPMSTEAWVGRFEPPAADPVRTWVDQGDGTGPQIIETLLALPDGGFAVAGFLNMAATGDDAVVARYGPDGSRVWRDLRDFSGGADRLFGLALAEDGDILASGYARDETSKSSYVVLRYAP